MSDITCVVSVDWNGISHVTLVEIPTAVVMHDRRSGDSVVGFAWFMCSPSAVMRWPTEVAQAHRDVDCMACIAARCEP